MTLLDPFCMKCKYLQLKQKSKEVCSYPDDKDDIMYDPAINEWYSKTKIKDHIKKILCEYYNDCDDCKYNTIEMKIYYHCNLFDKIVSEDYNQPKKCQECLDWKVIL